MRIEKLSASLGAEVHDLDIAEDLSGNEASTLKRALSEHGVLFMRDQDINSDALTSLARVFGEPVLNSHPKFGAVDGYPEIAVVTNDAENPPDINVWHSDTTFMQVPAGVCVLRCVELPAVGGDTLWSSMYSAYDALSPGMQDYLLTLDADHRLPMDNVPVELLRDIGEREVQAVHPVVRWIPEQERPSLFVNRVYTKRIIGLHRLESDGLLNLLFELAESPDFQVRFRWEKHSIAIWDNRMTQHFAVADYFPERRVMHRIALRGDSPIAARDAA